MSYIEFVGPSGIGKTTFLRHLVEITDERVWLTRKEVMQHIRDAEGGQKGPTNPERIVLKIARLLDLSVTYKSKKAEKLGLQDALREYDRDSYPFYEVFASHISRNKNLHTWQKDRLYRYYINSVLYRLILISHHAPDVKVVLDEGLIHNGGFSDLTQNESLLERVKKSSLIPDGVVFFDLSEDEYIKRIESRFEERGKRKINSLMVDVAPQELRRYVKRARGKSHQKLAACRRLDIPCIALEPRSDLANVGKACKFIDHVFAAD